LQTSKIKLKNSFLRLVKKLAEKEVVIEQLKATDMLL